MNKQEIPIDIAVSNLLKKWNIEYSVEYLGERNKRNWKHDLWNVIFKSYQAQENFEYSTGLGNRIGNRILKIDISKFAKPCPPRASETFKILILEARAESMDFNSWCEEFGYDNDSIKDQGIFYNCQLIGIKLRRIFSSDQIDFLNLILDY